MKCWHCGAENSGEAVFCQKCGGALATPRVSVAGAGTNSTLQGATSANAPVRSTLTAPMLAINPAIEPSLRPELKQLLDQWYIMPSKAVVSVHLMGQNYPLSQVEGLRQLLAGGWILPDTPVFLQQQERWFEARQCPGVQDHGEFDPENTKRLDTREEGDGTGPSEEATESKLILAAKLGHEAEKAASEQDYGRAIEIYEKVLQLNKQYPLVQRRLRELRKLHDVMLTSAGSLSSLPTDQDIDEKTSVSMDVMASLSAPPSLPRARPPTDGTAVLTLDDMVEVQDVEDPTSSERKPARGNPWLTLEEPTAQEVAVESEDEPSSGLSDVSQDRPFSAAVQEDRQPLLPSEDVPTQQRRLDGLFQRVESVVVPGKQPEPEVRRGIQSLDWRQLQVLLQEQGYPKRSEAMLREAFANSQVVCSMVAGTALIAVGRVLSDLVSHAMVCDVAVTQEYRTSDAVFQRLMETLLRNVKELRILLLLEPSLMELAHRNGFQPCSQTMIRSEFQVPSSE